MIESRSLRVTSPWGVGEKPTTDWETADSLPDRLLWERLCDEGRGTDGVACIECKLCAYGRKYVKLFSPEPKKPKPVYAPQHKGRFIRGFVGDKLIGEWASYRAAAEAVGASSPSTVFYAVKRNAHSMGVRFQLIEEVVE
jgi:hypothetical protein